MSKTAAGRFGELNLQPSAPGASPPSPSARACRSRDSIRCEISPTNVLSSSPSFARYSPAMLSDVCANRGSVCQPARDTVNSFSRTVPTSVANCLP